MQVYPFEGTVWLSITAFVFCDMNFPCQAKLDLSFFFVFLCVDNKT